MKLYDNDSYRDEFMNGVYALLSGDSTSDRANQIIDLFDLAPEVEVTMEQRNTPLTLDELRKMNGEPVWVECITEKKLNCWGLHADGFVRGYIGYFVDFYDYAYGEIWLAYRRKPEDSQ